MKQNNSGFSLVEIVAAIAILGIFFGAACSSLVLGLRINDQTQALLQEQLAVSSAVETLMAEGITEASETYDISLVTDDSGNPVLDADGAQLTDDRFPEVSVKTVEAVITNDGGNRVSLPYFEVTVTGSSGMTVVTHIRGVAE